MNGYKNSTLIFSIVMIFLIFLSLDVLANPIVKQVTIDPAKPHPLSTITFNATVLSNESITEAWLVVQECRNDMCFVRGLNVSMVRAANYTYQAQCTLEHGDATQIKYYFRFICNGIWYTSNITFLPLAVDTETNTTQDPQNPAPIPAFEIPVLILSVISILVFYKWKRKSFQKP